tara:strand:+ start:423 stop:605 length:183 start_codon:yes stop_codon:yes gene_type:complete
MKAHDNSVSGHSGVQKDVFRPDPMRLGGNTSNAGANKPHYKIFTIIGNAITISEDTGADP